MLSVLNGRLRTLCSLCSLWLCGSVALWLCGSVALWVCGSVANFLCPDIPSRWPHKAERRSIGPPLCFLETDQRLRGLSNQLRMRPAVREVKHEPDRKPHDEPQPVLPAESVDYGAAHDNAERGYHRYGRRPERPRQFRITTAQYPYPCSHQNECEQRSNS